MTRHALAAALALACHAASASPRAMTYYRQAGPTASGARYSAAAMACADRHLPLGADMVVTYQGRTEVVRINDRTARRTGAIDCTPAVMRALGVPLRAGRVAVEVAMAPERKTR